MPLYEYQCQSCGKRTEALQRFDDAPLTVCPHCGGELKKLISAPAVQFKGTGWYVTDYAKKGSSAGKAGSSESKADSGKKETAAESKSGGETSGGSSSAGSTAAASSGGSSSSGGSGSSGD